MLAVVAMLGIISQLAFNPYTVNAQSQQICDSVIFDEPGVLGNNKNLVQTEIDNLGKLGVNARVVVVKAAGKELRSYGNDLVKRCESWQSTDGGARNNFVVIIVSVNEHQTAVLYGDEWKKTLDPQWARIVDQRLNPRFRDGDFSGGIANGLKEINRLLNIQINPPTQNGSNPPVVIQTQTEPTDFTGLWWVLGIFAIASLVFVIFLIVSRAMKARSLRQGAKRAAIQAKNSAISQINEVQRRQEELQSLVAVVNSRISEADGSEMSKSLKEAEELLSKAARDLANNTNSGNDPERKGLTEADFKQIEASFKSILEVANSAELALDRVQVQQESIRTEIESIPWETEELEKGLATTDQMIEDVASKGLKTEKATSLLSQARSLLGESKTLLESRNLAQARSKLNEAKSVNEQTQNWLSSLQQLKLELEGALGDLKNDVPLTQDQITLARKVYEALDAEYPDSSLETIRGNGTESINHLGSATTLLENAASKLSTQDWDEAQEALQQARTELEKAKSLVKSIFSLKDTLEKAKEGATNEITLANNDIDRARSYVQSHDDDLPESYEKALDDSMAALVRARDELSKAKPDYLVVVRLAQEANSAADRILDSARSDVEKLERQRTLAESSYRDALLAISVAEEYYEDHDEDIDESVGDQIQRAKRDLERYGSTSDLALQIAIAQESKQLAESMLSESKEAFQSAERRRRDSNGGGWGSPGSYSGGSSSFGRSGGLSGGFGGFGSSGGFSGGSIGFGGGGGGLSGGSKGW